MPLNILGMDGQPRILEGGNVWFVDCQVSTYKSISDAAAPLTDGDVHTAALNLSAGLFGDSPGQAHFVRSHLLVPLQVRNSRSSPAHEADAHTPDQTPRRPAGLRRRAQPIEQRAAASGPDGYV